jgi:protein-serine/threonine kinase
MSKLYFVLEYCAGGELFYHLSRARRFSEDRSRFYSSEIALAIGHLHSFDIIYRDMKPENILLDMEGHVKVTDFGLSKEGVKDNFSAKSMCGTPEYLAPEILSQNGHGKAVDWYSLGAIMYEMMTGLPPFYSQDREKLFARIQRGSVCLKYPDHLTPTAKSVLHCFLQRDPDQRLGGGPGNVDEVKAHDFFESLDWVAILEKRVTPPFKPSLSGFTDVKYFEKEFLDLPVNPYEVYDDVMACHHENDGLMYDVRHFEGFSYQAPGIMAG